MRTNARLVKPRGDCGPPGLVPVPAVHRRAVCTHEHAHSYVRVCAPVQWRLPWRHVQAGAWPVPALPATPPLCRECPGPGAAGRARKPLPAAVPSFREATRWRAARRARLPLHLSPGLPGRPWEAQPPALHGWVPRPDPHHGGMCSPLPPAASGPLAVRTRREASRVC